MGFVVEPPHSPVLIPDGQRCEHTVCIGKTGAGKTYLLERLALEVAKRHEGFAFFDFHGDASLSLLGLSRFGVAARAIVFALLGWGLVVAGWFRDAAEVGTTASSLRMERLFDA